MGKYLPADINVISITLINEMKGVLNYDFPLIWIKVLTLTVAFIILEKQIAELQFPCPVWLWHMVHDEAAMMPSAIWLRVDLEAHLQELQFSTVLLLQLLSLPVNNPSVTLNHTVQIPELSPQQQNTDTPVVTQITTQIPEYISNLSDRVQILELSPQQQNTATWIIWASNLEKHRNWLNPPLERKYHSMLKLKFTNKCLFYYFINIKCYDFYM